MNDLHVLEFTALVGERDQTSFATIILGNNDCGTLPRPNDVAIIIASRVLAQIRRVLTPAATSFQRHAQESPAAFGSRMAGTCDVA